MLNMKVSFVANECMPGSVDAPGHICNLNLSALVRGHTN